MALLAALPAARGDGSRRVFVAMLRVVTAHLWGTLRLGTLLSGAVLSGAVLSGTLLSGAVLSGCGGAPSTPVECNDPPPIAVTIEASEHLNPDPEGRPLPTELRVYQLRDAAAIDEASFEDLWERSAEVLGAAELSEEIVTLYPGDRLERSLAPDPAASAILAVAIVREPAGRTWRVLVPISTPPGGDTCAARQPAALVIRLDDHRIEAITPRAPETRR